MLNVLLWALALWFGIWGIVLLPFHFADWYWSLQNQIVTDVGLISALVLLRRGRFRAAIFTYLGSIWLFATHVMTLSGGIRSNVQALYVTLPISAAWLLGYEAAFWISGACMSCTLVFAVLELAGVNMRLRIPGTPLGVWAVFGMACLIGAVPVAQILRDLRFALTKSREAEDKSLRAMERLEAEIEEHKRTERALLESEQRFRVTADTAPVMILVQDAGHNATFFNKVWLDFTGRAVEQELGAGWTAGVHPNDFESCVAHLCDERAERKEFHLQFRLRRADGEHRLLLCHGVPRLELDGGCHGYIASCVDITDLKRSQEEALARQKWESLGVLAGGIAHDFNNLLGGISVLAELLLEEVQETGSRESLFTIQSVAARGSEIVRQLMVYAGQESATLELIDVAAVVREMLPLMKFSASKNAKFEVDLLEGLPLIRANVTQIRRVLLNLVTNASEALGGEQGIITVRLAEKLSGDEPPKPSGAHYLCLEVSDTGCGMTEQVRAGIFDPFFTTKGAGRGLGLSAVKGIVHGHGGDISIVSSPGHGSRFEIFLPIATQLEQVPDEGGMRNNTECFKGTVLMIEDEEILRRAVAELLRAKGVRVLEASDGRTAVELFRAHASEIDIAVLDMTLPGLSSREVLQKLREIQASVKVVITSAHGRNQALRMVNGEPSQPYIRKPYRVNELLDLIQKA